MIDLPIEKEIRIDDITNTSIVLSIKIKTKFDSLFRKCVDSRLAIKLNDVNIKIRKLISRLPMKNGAVNSLQISPFLKTA